MTCNGENVNEMTNTDPLIDIWIPAITDYAEIFAKLS